MAAAADEAPLDPLDIYGPDHTWRRAWQPYVDAVRDVVPAAVARGGDEAILHLLVQLFVVADATTMQANMAPIENYFKWTKGRAHAAPQGWNPLIASPRTRAIAFLRYHKTVGRAMRVAFAAADLPMEYLPPPNVPSATDPTEARLLIQNVERTRRYIRERRGLLIPCSGYALCAGHYIDVVEDDPLLLRCRIMGTGPPSWTEFLIWNAASGNWTFWEERIAWSPEQEPRSVHSSDDARNTVRVNPILPNVARAYALSEAVRQLGINALDGRAERIIAAYTDRQHLDLDTARQGQMWSPEQAQRALNDDRYQQRLLSLHQRRPPPLPSPSPPPLPLPYRPGPDSARIAQIDNYIAAVRRRTDALEGEKPKRHRESGGRPDGLEGRCSVCYLPRRKQ